jgi:Xaa-Pro dipeptidase
MCFTSKFRQINQLGDKMSANIHQNRQKDLQSLLQKSDLKAVGLNPGPDLTYITGLDFHLMERPVMGIFPKSGEPVFILPELESAKLASLPFKAKSFLFNEDPATWSDVFRSALQGSDLLSGRLGIIPRRFRFLEHTYIQDAAPDLQLVSAQSLLSQMRRIKSEDEINFMSEAARIAECALSSTTMAIKPGVTEKEIAGRLVSRLFLEGSDPELPFFPIVSFGENAANPHATPTDRVLNPGDIILIDWGASHNGYYSDITRVFAMGDLHPEIDQIAKFVKAANAAGRAAVKPGIPASAVDQAARQVIEDAGYGEYFFHRTGHGLGREAHEEPYISQFDQTILEPGMTFTIEPGIYLPQRGGVRIEDDIVVTKDGGLSLTRSPRELTQLSIEE